jgi:transposase InsO family protein
MKYEFMAAHQWEHRIGRMCRVLEVSRSGYYAWQARRSSVRARANQALLLKIREVHRTSRQTYGAPRIQAALRQAGIFCSRKRVAHLMQRHGIIGRLPHRHRPQTTQRNLAAVPAPNRLNQDFSSPAPDRKWVSDITYIDTAEGWLYLAVVLDLFSRRVVGWAMDEHMEASLVQAAWQMAVSQRTPSAELLHHSDQGRQYTSQIYQQELAAYDCQVSMSRAGNCYDNAAMESFFSTLKAECATSQFATQAQARSAIFEYMEAWYNRQRLHSTLGYLSPLEFEQSGH